ncbi:polA [Symbiodinium microadriaticum]|nr:polA [Symbiodinium microadriaticum]
MVQPAGSRPVKNACRMMRDHEEQDLLRKQVNQDSSDQDLEFVDGFLMPADTSSACYVILSEAAKFECTLVEFLAVLASHIFAFSCTGLLLRFVFLETQKTPVDFSAVVSSESYDLSLAVVCVAVFVLEVLPELLTHFELAQKAAMDEVFSKDDWPTKAAQFILTSPKFPLCTSLVLFGSWFILASESNKDLILNTVALTFVNNIDNSVYAMFVSRRLQRKITNTALVKVTRARIDLPKFSAYSEGASLAERPKRPRISEPSEEENSDSTEGSWEDSGSEESMSSSSGDSGADEKLPESLEPPVACIGVTRKLPGSQTSRPRPPPAVRSLRLPGPAEEAFQAVLCAGPGAAFYALLGSRAVYGSAEAATRPEHHGTQPEAKRPFMAGADPISSDELFESLRQRPVIVAAGRRGTDILRWLRRAGPESLFWDVEVHDPGLLRNVLHGSSPDSEIQACACTVASLQETLRTARELARQLLESSGELAYSLLLRSQSTVAAMEASVLLASNPAGLNLRSNSQVASLLARQLSAQERSRWPCTPGGALRTDSDSLRRSGLPWAEDVVRFRELSHALSHYEPYISLAKCGGGRLFPSYQLAGAVTGRMTCANPNLQSSPRLEEFRSLFRAGLRPGWDWLVQGDFSQIELRVLAELAEDEQMKAIFRAGEVQQLQAALQAKRRFVAEQIVAEQIKLDDKVKAQRQKKRLPSVPVFTEEEEWQAPASLCISLCDVTAQEVLQSEATIRVNFPNSTSKTYESQSDRPHRELPLAKSPSTWRKQLSAGTEEIWTCQTCDYIHKTIPKYLLGEDMGTGWRTVEELPLLKPIIAFPLVQKNLASSKAPPDTGDQTFLMQKTIPDTINPSAYVTTTDLWPIGSGQGGTADLTPLSPELTFRENVLLEDPAIAMDPALAAQLQHEQEKELYAHMQNQAPTPTEKSSQLATNGSHTAEVPEEIEAMEEDQEIVYTHPDPYYNGAEFWRRYGRDPHTFSFGGESSES